jgi:hypothetical protein
LGAADRPHHLQQVPLRPPTRSDHEQYGNRTALGVLHPARCRRSARNSDHGNESFAVPGNRIRRSLTSRAGNRSCRKLMPFRSLRHTRPPISPLAGRNHFPHRIDGQLYRVEDYGWRWPVAHRRPLYGDAARHEWLGARNELIEIAMGDLRKAYATGRRTRSIVTSGAWCWVEGNIARQVLIVEGPAPDSIRDRWLTLLTAIIPSSFVRDERAGD